MSENWMIVGCPRIWKSQRISLVNTSERPIAHNVCWCPNILLTGLAILRLMKRFFTSQVYCLSWGSFSAAVHGLGNAPACHCFPASFYVHQHGSPISLAFPVPLSALVDFVHHPVFYGIGCCWKSMSQPYLSTLWFNVFNTFIDLCFRHSVPPFPQLLPSLSSYMEQVWRVPPRGLLLFALPRWACLQISSWKQTYITTCRIDTSPRCWQFPVVRRMNTGYGADSVHGEKSTGNIWSLVGNSPVASPSITQCVAPTASSFDSQTCASVSFAADNKHLHMTLKIQT